MKTLRQLLKKRDKLHEDLEDINFGLLNHGDDRADEWREAYAKIAKVTKKIRKACRKELGIT